MNQSKIDGQIKTKESLPFHRSFKFVIFIIFIMLGIIFYAVGFGPGLWGLWGLFAIFVMCCIVHSGAPLGILFFIFESIASLVG